MASNSKVDDMDTPQMEDLTWHVIHSKNGSLNMHPKVDVLNTPKAEALTSHLKVDGLKLDPFT